MKLKVKIILIFVSSIIISLVIFMAVIVYLMMNGWWAGISTYDMNTVSDGTAVQIHEAGSFEKEKIKPLLEEWKRKYTGMELELFSNGFQLIYSTASKQQINSLDELLQTLSRHGQFSQERWAAAREITLQNGEKCYLAVIVPAKYYAAISYSINMPKGTGIFGQMFLIGLGITLLISSAFAYLFTKNIVKRFSALYGGISRFELGNMNVNINDNSNDELGYLALTFNRMSKRLKEQMDEEKRYQEERKKLVSDISHDLRTPLTSIIGYSESLENNVYEDEEEKKKFITIIRKKALYMDKLLRELLEYSKLEAGRYTLKKAREDVSELVREILIEYLPVLQENNMELITDIPEEPLTACIDRDGVSRVLRNLMDNAIKYGRDGNLVEVLLLGEKDAFRIVIKDAGQGIEKRNMEMIFKRFYRVDKSRNTRDGGMGLGLAIAHEIVKMHGGRIFAESTVGEGTTFTIVLPI